MPAIQNKNNRTHATRSKDIRVRKFPEGQKLLRWTILALLLSLLLWGWAFLKNPKNFPITSVQIHGTYSHINPNRLKTVLMPYMKRNLFNVDIEGIRKTLLLNSWLWHVAVSRRWPHTLVVTIEEQHPVAIWIPNGPPIAKDEESDALLNSVGLLFYPKIVPVSNLPILMGPKDQEKEVWNTYETLKKSLMPLDLTITHLKISDSEALSLNLSNGIELILGKEDIMPRMLRFVQVYGKVFSLKQEIDDVVDMRYTNGMAVGQGQQKRKQERSEKGSQ